jgi:hypothetical protein
MHGALRLAGGAGQGVVVCLRHAPSSALSRLSSSLDHRICHIWYEKKQMICPNFHYSVNLPLESA